VNALITICQEYDAKDNIRSTRSIDGTGQKFSDLAEQQILKLFAGVSVFYLAPSEEWEPSCISK